MSNPKVKVTMENGGEYTIELYPEFAPATVANFLKLVNSGLYKGHTFHRVVDNFMAQGGDPDGTGCGGSDETIMGEFASNGFAQNTLSHTRGVLSMARSANKNSASSQFFICFGDCSFLDGDYAAFGKVIDGMDVVNEIAQTRTSWGDKPIKPQVMESVTVECFGVEYPEPEKC